MANFLRTRALWADDTDFLYTEAEDLDIKTAAAINGEGGTYALVDPLVIGGAPGVTTTFYTDVILAADSFIGADPSSLVYVNSVAQFVSDATFDANVIFNDGVTFNDNVGMLGSTVLGSSTADSVLVLGDFSVVPDADFSGDVEVAGGVFVNGASEFLNTLTAYGNVLLGGPGIVDVIGDTVVRSKIEFVDYGRIVERTVIGANSNTSYSPRTVDLVYVPPGGLSADVTYTIDDTGCVNGDSIRFASEEVNMITINDPGGSPIATGASVVQLKSATNFLFSVTCQRVSGTWRATQKEYW